MNQTVGTDHTRSASTTYAQLTHRAARAIGGASLAVLLDRYSAPRHDPPAEVAAVRDVAAALVHLGTILRSSPAGSTVGRRTAGSGRDAVLIDDLRRVARARDWEAAHPGAGAAADLDRAATLIRAAADLWATHHRPDGGPRSPEAARMRHPSMRGAASRQWRCLVTLAADAAAVVSAEAQRHDRGIDGLSEISGFPRPTAGNPADPGARLLNVTVARPAVPAGQEPVVELAGRVERLRRRMWLFARTGDAPAAVHTNTALIATAVHGAAAAAHERAAIAGPAGASRRRHLQARADAQRGLDNWKHVAAHVRCLRTPHPVTHPIQVERLDIERLIGRVLPVRASPMPGQIAWELSRIARLFDEVATYCVQTIRLDHEHGQVLLVGRAIPTEALPRRPDLLHARLHDRVVVVPPISMNRLLMAYDVMTRSGPSGSAPPASPPAA